MIPVNGEVLQLLLILAAGLFVLGLYGVLTRKNTIGLLVGLELMANAVDHGGGGGAMETKDLTEDVRMELRMSFDGKTWTLSVEDHGTGDLAEAEQCLTREPGSALAELEAERGRGLFLIHDMADELSIHRGDRGLVFTATKSL